MNFENVVIVCNSRAERGPLQSVMDVMPGAEVASVNVEGTSPQYAVKHSLAHFSRVLVGKHLVVVLGDRYETFAAALAAYFQRIPIAHIHGGERTVGAFDDAFRDSITRMATYHFAAIPRAPVRIREILGSAFEPEKCILAGAPGLDGIQQNSAKRDQDLILVTYHPETMAPDYGIAALKAMLAALASLSNRWKVLFTGVNADPGRDEIVSLIDHACSRINAQWEQVITIPHSMYIEFMQRAKVVVGNSSAGIIEAPWVGCPTVNIGGRQNGRPFANSIFQAYTSDVAGISEAIGRALAFGGDPRPVYRGGAAAAIVDYLRREMGGINGDRVGSIGGDLSPGAPSQVC